jgi:hypothetical protein
MNRSMSSKQAFNTATSRSYFSLDVELVSSFDPAESLTASLSLLPYPGPPGGPLMSSLPWCCDSVIKEEEEEKKKKQSFENLCQSWVLLFCMNSSSGMFFSEIQFEKRNKRNVYARAIRGRIATPHQ